MPASILVALSQSATPAGAQILASAPRGWQRYAIRPGDTLWDLAQRYHTSTSLVAKHNRLAGHGHFLRVGQVIEVPAASAGSRTPGSRRPPAPAITRTTYIVRAGDTLSAIGERRKVSLPALLKANRLASPHRIFPGQRLVIPVSGRARTPAPTRTRPAPYPTVIKSTPAANRAQLARASVPSRLQTKALIFATAKRHGVDPRLALAIGWQESGWNQRAVSSSNAIGTMQIMPTSGVWASGLVGRRLNILAARDNVTAGVAMLRALNRSAKNLDQVIAAYYQGLTSVRTRGMYRDTVAYVASVKALMKRM